MRLETQYMSFSIKDYRSVKNEKRTKQEKNSALERRHSQLYAHINNALANSRGRDTETTKYPQEGVKIGWQMPHPGDLSNQLTVLTRQQQFDPNSLHSRQKW